MQELTLGFQRRGERVSEHAHLRWARRECFLQLTCSHGQGVWPKIPEKGLENQVFTPVTHNIKINNENKNPPFNNHLQLNTQSRHTASSSNFTSGLIKSATVPKVYRFTSENTR